MESWADSEIGDWQGGQFMRDPYGATALVAMVWRSPEQESCLVMFCDVKRRLKPRGSPGYAYLGLCSIATRPYGRR